MYQGMADIRGSLIRIRFCSSPCQVFQRNAEWPQLVRVGFFFSMAPLDGTGPVKQGEDHGVTSLIWLPIHLRIRCQRCYEVSFQPHSSFSNTTSAAMAGAILKAPETVSRQCASMALISMPRFAPRTPRVQNCPSASSVSATRRLLGIASIAS